MQIIDIYVNKDKRLVLQESNHETGKVDRKCFDDDVEIYLSKISKIPIKDIHEGMEDGKYISSINFQGFSLKLHDIDNFDDKQTFLTPLFNSVKTHYEQKNMSEIQEGKKDKKYVTRNNKYINNKILAGIIAGGILFTTMLGVGRTNQKKYNANNEISNDVTFTIDDDKNNDFSTNLINESVIYEGFDLIDKIIYDITNNEVVLEYEDLSNTDKAIYAKENYGIIIEKYSNRYGLDPKLMLGIATQERGIHSSVMDQGGATGLMQIQNSVWIDKEISAFNFETGEYDKFTVTNDMISNLESNIQLGCMVFQNCLRYVNYNIPMAIQAYNFGIGNMKKVISAYSSNEGKTVEEIMNSQTDTGWIDYRSLVQVGDPMYLNNVFSWIGEQNDISVMKPDNTEVNLTVSNHSLVVNKTY